MDSVLIAGDHFVYSSVVTFNGGPTRFATASGNFIHAVVPAGATTGPVTITNPGGTSVSAEIFTVTQ